MSRQTWITRDGEGNVVSSTEVRRSSGCSSCFWVVLAVFLLVGPATWAANGQIPVIAAVGMYLVEALIGVAALRERGRRRRAAR